MAPRRSLCRWLWLGNVTQYADSEALVPGGRVQSIGPDTECVFGSGRRVSNTRTRVEDEMCPGGDAESGCFLDRF